MCFQGVYSRWIAFYSNNIGRVAGSEWLSDLGIHETCEILHSSRNLPGLTEKEKIYLKQVIQ